MKLKYCISILLVSCVNLCVVAQPIHKSAHVQWGQRTKTNAGTFLQDVVGQNATSLYATKFNAHGWYGYFHSFSLERYDHELNLKATQEIDLHFPEGKRQLAFVLYVKNHLYLFTSFHDKSSEKSQLYVQEVDAESLAVGKSRKIAEVTTMSKNSHKDNLFGYTFSPDSSALLVYHSQPSTKKRASQTSLFVFDQQVQPVWQQKLPDISIDKQMKLLSYAIDDHYQVHMLSEISSLKKHRRSSSTSSKRYQIFQYKNNSNALYCHPLLMADEYIRDAQLMVTENQQLICTGFYTDRPGGNIEGTFLVPMHRQSGAAMPVRLQPILSDQLTPGSKKTALADYVLKDVVQRRGGGMTLVAEQYHRTAVSGFLSKVFSTTPTDYYHSCGNVLVTDLDRQGKLRWVQQIYKQQSSVNNGGRFSSYALSVVGNKLYFIFNDNPKNLVSRHLVDGTLTGATPRVYPLHLRNRSAVVAMVEVDAQGDQKKSPLYMQYDAGVMTRPQLCKQISNNEMVIFGQHKRLHITGKITFRQPIYQITSN